MAAKIKVIIRTIMCWIINVFGLRKNIVLEMEPGRCDNTDALFKRMIELGWNKTRKIVIVAYNVAGFEFKYPNVIVIKPALSECCSSVWRLLANTWEVARAAIIIDCNAQIEKINSKTIHVYSAHGHPVKNLGRYYNCREDVDYTLIKGEFWRPIVSQQRKVSPEKILCLGFPRNDCLLRSDGDIHMMFDCAYKKIIAWYPTFRQHKGVKKLTGIGIPVIHDIETAKLINAIAAKYGVLIVVKPHPVQNLGNIKEVNLSNIRFIYNDFFVNNKITSYEFLAQTDALITDYSSVFTDYIITGKPIALTFEDVEEYREKTGFAIDTELLTCCSEMLYTTDDFERFFCNLANNIDTYKEKRVEVMHLMDDFCDAKSTERVINWLADLIR